MEQLRLLKFECDIPGLIRINGELSGQTPAQNLCRYAAEQRICLEFLPICSVSQGCFLPITRLIDFGGEHPSVLENDGVLSLFLLPGNACAIRIRPPRLPSPCIPCSVASLNFSMGSGQYAAELYRDQSTNLILCDPAGNPVLAYMLCQEELHAPRLFMRRMGGRAYLFIEGDVPPLRLICCVDPVARSVVFSERCLSYRIAENSMEFTLPCAAKEFSLQCRCSDLQKGPRFSYRLQPLSAAPGGLSLCAALLEAIRYGDESGAMALLTPSLREQLSFADLQEFVGDIHGIYEELCSDTRAAALFSLAPHLFAVRFFEFQIRQGLIANLEEQS